MTDAARQRALAFADTLAARCSEALGDAVLAVILHGSLILAEFTPERSDIDLLVVVASRLSDDRLAALREAVDQVREDAPTRVDLRVVTRATTRSPTLAPLMEAALSIRPGRALEVEARIAEPDLVVEFAIARAHGRSIVGHAPADVIDPVPAQAVLEVADRQLAAWQRLTDDADHAELMVLTACRVWRFAVERVHCSKAAAGRWALERDPSLGVVAEALRQRTSDPAATICEAGIARVLALVRHELRRAPSEPIEVVAYDPHWPTRFQEHAARIRAALRDVALRIDHIGSTAVAGLAAKPIVDIQISVESLEPPDDFRDPLQRLGYVFRADNPELTKRYFREPPGSRRTHIHVRRAGSFSEQLALLLRDFMRAHPEWAQRYGDLKLALAERHAHDRARYTESKRPFTWEALAAADEWAQRTGWLPGPSDA